MRCCDIQNNQGSGKGYQPKPLTKTLIQCLFYCTLNEKRQGSHAYASSLSGSTQSERTRLHVTLSVLDMIIV